MIDFRYHLVSIIAVFLALAIGIVVGSTALQPAVEGSLHRAESLLRQRNDSLLQRNTALSQQVSADQAFAQAGAGLLLGRLLAGQRVVLVTAPNADSQVVSGITTAVRQAGGQVTGDVALQSDFFDGTDAAESRLTQLAQSLAPDVGVSLPSQPASSTVSGQQQAAQVLAAAIVSKDGTAISSAQSREVLGGFGNSGYLQVSTPSGGSPASLPQASLAVVVQPSAPPAANEQAADNDVLIAVAQELQSSGRGTVLAGSADGSGQGSAVSQESGSGKVSTVDNADTQVGQITTVQALWELLAGRSPNSYGMGPGVVPSPAPTSSASPATDPAHQVRKR